MLLIEEESQLEEQIRQSVAMTAADKKAGMTLDDLARFVQLAMRREVPGDARVTCLIGWSRQIQSLEVSS